MDFGSTSSALSRKMNLGVVVEAFFDGTKPMSYAAGREANYPTASANMTLL